MKRDANPIESESTCLMCGQPLVDKQAAAHVADYEKRTEARLLGELAPQAIAVAEGKKLSRNSVVALELVVAAVPEQGAGELDEAEVVGGLLVVADQQRSALP